MLNSKIEKNEAKKLIIPNEHNKNDMNTNDKYIRKDNNDDDEDTNINMLGLEYKKSRSGSEQKKTRDEKKLSILSRLELNIKKRKNNK